jgi:hypothetical protein
MVAVAAAVMMVAPVPPVGDLDCASGMEVGKGVRRRTAPRAQKVILASAYLMGVGGVASFRNVPRVHREAQSSARRMVEESAAHSWAVPKGLKVAHHIARDRGEASAAYLRVVACAQRVCMVGLSIVLHTVVGRGAPFLIAPRVLEGGQSTVYATAVARDAGLRAV